MIHFTVARGQQRTQNGTFFSVLKGRRSQRERVSEDIVETHRHTTSSNDHIMVTSLHVPKHPTTETTPLELKLLLF